MCMHVDAYYGTAFDLYALGYCIANFHTGVPWGITIGNNFVPFLCGLKTKTPSVGVIQQLHIFKCPDVDVEELSYRC